MNMAMSVWLIGTAAGALSTPAIIRLGQKSRRPDTRTAAAQVHADWNTQNGRAALLLAQPLLWPIFLTVLLVATVCHATRNTP